MPDYDGQLDYFPAAQHELAEALRHDRFLSCIRDPETEARHHTVREGKLLVTALV